MTWHDPPFWRWLRAATIMFFVYAFSALHSDRFDRDWFSMIEIALVLVGITGYDQYRSGHKEASK